MRRAVTLRYGATPHGVEYGANRPELDLSEFARLPLVEQMDLLRFLSDHALVEAGNRLSEVGDTFNEAQAKFDALMAENTRLKNEAALLRAGAVHSEVGQ